MVTNRCGDEKGEINQKDEAMTRYIRDNQRRETGTRAGELDIACYSMTLHKPTSLNAALEVQMKDSQCSGLTVIESSEHITVRLMFVRVKHAATVLDCCKEINPLNVGLDNF